MDPTAEPRLDAEQGSVSPCAPIVWETTRVLPVPRSDVGNGARDLALAVKRWVEHGFDILSRPTFGQLHGRSPIETTRIATTSGSAAAGVLDHTAAISWGRGRGAGRLQLEPFRATSTELGRPWIADAVLHGSRMRRLRVSVAIFDYGTQRCGIQIRPAYRRPWSSRRLRRCLRFTHGASHRLRELVLAVDFMPPGHVAAGPT